LEEEDDRPVTGEKGLSKEKQSGGKRGKQKLKIY